MQFKGTVKKRKDWANKGGQFIDFDERPETFWKWGVTDLKEGDQLNIDCQQLDFGDLQGTMKITKYSRAGAGQEQLNEKTLPASSAIAEAAESTGAYLKTKVANLELRTDCFPFDEQIKMHDMAIAELRAVVDKLLTRIIAVEQEKLDLEVRLNEKITDLSETLQRVDRDQEQKLRTLQDKAGVSFV